MQKIPSSFRDPSGFLYQENNTLYRIINTSYKKHYDWLLKSNLYNRLTKEKLLIPHVEVENINTQSHYKTIKPQLIPFVSYPYEWSFSQLKTAALLTLKIQNLALKHSMILKDASSYNVQFQNGKPIFIDTLSFEIYEKNNPWVAYKQFCQHFLAPLSLMSYTDISLNSLLKTYIDGIPLDIASKLLPLKTHLKPSLKLHIHLHAKAQKSFEKKQNMPKRHQFSLNAFNGLIDNLYKSIEKLHWNAIGTEWAEYYQDNSYTKNGFQEKKEIIHKYFKQTQPKNVWDLGANNGTFSEIAEQYNANVIAFDIDPACVEKNYCRISKKEKTTILPLRLDLTNPSPNLGWNHEERKSFKERGPVDLIMALALIHHLAISNNIPLDKLSSFFASLTKWLIIEFVPKSDKKVQTLLATRKDIFSSYTLESFEKEFSKLFKIKNKTPIQNSKRILYLMEKKS